METFFSSRFDAVKALKGEYDGEQTNNYKELDNIDEFERYLCEKYMNVAKLICKLDVPVKKKSKKQEQRERVERLEQMAANHGRELFEQKRKPKKNYKKIPPRDPSKPLVTLTFVET